MKATVCMILSFFLAAGLKAQTGKVYTETRESDWLAVSLPPVERPAAPERSATVSRPPARTASSRPATNRATTRTSTTAAPKPKTEPQASQAKPSAPFQNTNSKIQRFKKKG